ncbi:MAG: DnaD domain protein [Bacilli bacterium]|nr:DnaD domain protein [Bacilli bacterium]
MELNQFDFDWKSLLIKRYRNYDLDETECMVIFVSDAVLNVDKDALITKETLSPYMKNIDKIDVALSNLISKEILVISTENGGFSFSLDDFKKRLVEDALKDIALKKNQSASHNESLYEELETIANRTLTPLERDQITHWLRSGADEKMIKEACSKAITSSGINFKQADRLILEMERSESRVNIGASMVDEDSKRKAQLQDIFSNTDWSYHGDK